MGKCFRILVVNVTIFCILLIIKYFSKIVISIMYFQVNNIPLYLNVSKKVKY